MTTSNTTGTSTAQTGTGQTGTAQTGTAQTGTEQTRAEQTRAEQTRAEQTNTVHINTAQVDRFLRSAQQVLPPPDRWPQVNTYPNSLAECIIDAIWSERVRYTNVIEIVDRYRAFRQAQGADADRDGARALVDTFGLGVAAWMEQIGNHQRVYSRDQAPYKAELVLAAGQAALAAGVDSTADLRAGYDADTPVFRDLRQRWLDLPSEGSGISWGRLLLSAGIETVPLDSWLADFASAALGAPVATAEAMVLADSAAPAMGVTGFRLRNAIWIYQHRLARGAHRRPHESDRVAPGPDAPPTL
ncbi:MAG: hypothetical protein LBE08_01390 [Bifidobacteriaceae bacterium]|jgi:hypothetical protein|nr:hypothetical protein [Bifidobacteriaceae bacterium]